MPIIDLEFSDEEELPEGSSRLNSKQVWIPKDLPKSECPNCKGKRLVQEPGTKLLHCPDCGHWEDA